MAYTYKINASEKNTEIRFISLKDYDPADSYELNGKEIKLLNIDGTEIVSGWSKDVPVDIILSEDKTVGYVNINYKEGSVDIPDLHKIWDKEIGKVYMIKNLISSGDMQEDSWETNGSSISYSSEHFKYGNRALKITAQSSMPELTVANKNNIYLNSTHIYYGRWEGYQEVKAGVTASMYWPISEPSFGSVGLGEAGVWNLYSWRVQRNSFTSGSYPLRIDYDNGNVNGTIWADGVMLVDLTDTFGSGNEPTKEWCDANIPFINKSGYIQVIEDTYVSSMCIYNKYLYVGCDNGYLIKTDLETGDLVGLLSVYEQPIKDMSILNGYMYVCSSNKIDVFDLSTDKLINKNLSPGGSSLATYNSISSSTGSVDSRYTMPFVVSGTTSSGEYKAQLLTYSNEDVSTNAVSDIYSLFGDFTNEIKVVRCLNDPNLQALDFEVVCGSFDKTVRKYKGNPKWSEVWEFTKHTGFVQALAVDNNLNIYSGAGDGYVYKINSENGEEIWHYLYGSVVRNISVDNLGYVYITGNSGEVHKLDSNGNLIWKFSVSESIMRSICIKDSNIYIGGDNNELLYYSENVGMLYIDELSGYQSVAVSNKDGKYYVKI